MKFCKSLSLCILVFSYLFCSPVKIEAQVPQRTNDNLIVASYNIKWLRTDNHDLVKLAQVIKNFDVCGIQEVKDATALSLIVEKLDSITGNQWGYVCSLRTNRPNSTYYEAFGVIWRKDRVELGSGLISNAWDKEEVYRHDPFLVSFKSGNFDFTMFLIHTRWSNDDYGSRAGEVLQISEHISYLHDIALERDIILMGDFNYPGTHFVMAEMADDANMIQIDKNEKTTFKGDFTGYANSYDHFYINQHATLNHEYIDGSCKVFDVTPYIYGNSSIENMMKSKAELSDHLPVYAVFDTSKQDDD